MYVDTRLGVSHLGDDAGNEGYPQREQLVGDAVVGDGPYGGVAEDDLGLALCGRVAVVHGGDVGRKYAPHLGQIGYEVDRLLFGYLFELFRVVVYKGVVGCEQQSGRDLTHQQVEELFDVDAGVVEQVLVAHIGRTVEAGEDERATECDEFLQLWSRREHLSLAILVVQLFERKKIGQFLDRLFQIFGIFIAAHGQC